jgi:predicted RNA-binding Zn ribbon-like protein
MSQANFDPYMECSVSLAVDLVNSEDPVAGRDDLAEPAGLAAFLAAHKMRIPKPTRGDLGQIQEVRSALREVFHADRGRAVEILNGLLASSGARPVLTDHDGPWHLHYTPIGTPIAPRIAAEAAMALSVVIASTGFDRLRTCEGERCVDVFVDESRNRSRRYCSPNVCGNRASVAAYRARQKATESASR